MKSNKIIVIFIVIIIAMFGGYFVYKHNQKVSLAQYYYNIGDYKKASDLKVGDVSNKALSIVNAMDWKDDINKYLKYNDKFYLDMFDLTISNIYSANLLFKHGVGDKDEIDILNGFYKDIADYLGISINKLDELNGIGSEKRIIEFTKILNEK